MISKHVLLSTLALFAPVPAAHAACTTADVAGKWIYVFQNVVSFPAFTGACTLTVTPSGGATSDATSCKIGRAGSGAINTYPHGKLTIDEACRLTGTLYWIYQASGGYYSRVSALLTLYRVSKLAYAGVSDLNESRGPTQGYLPQQLVRVSP